jgi:hypothetical protein
MVDKVAVAIFLPTSVFLCHLPLHQCYDSPSSGGRIMGPTEAAATEASPHTIPTNQPTTCSRLLEKLLVPQLGKTALNFVKPEVSLQCTQNPAWVRGIQPMPPHPISLWTRFRLSSPLRRGFHKSFTLQVPTPKPCMHTSLSSTRTPRPSYLPWYDQPNIWWAEEIIKISRRMRWEGM